MMDLEISPVAESFSCVDELQISTWSRKDGSIWGDVFRTTCGYRILIRDFCEFEFDSKGDNSRCRLLADLTESDARHLFEVNVVPLILGLKKKSVFHGSCVRVGQTGVVILGASGQGKSTLTASFALNGYPFLSDDVLVVDPVEPPVAHSDNAAIRLWQASIDALFPGGSRSEPYASYSNKRRVAADRSVDHVVGTAPIGAAFVLGDEAEKGLSTERVSGATAHWHWMNNMFVLDIGREDVMPYLFDAAARIASAVPTYLISYPRDFGRLSDVRQQILETVESVCDNAYISFKQVPSF